MSRARRVDNNQAEIIAALDAAIAELLASCRATHDLVAALCEKMAEIEAYT